VSVDAPTVDTSAEDAGTRTPRCAIGRLRLHCFRNYTEATVRFGPGLNVIHGQNAQGKTNLLEAIATLALTRSPRTTSGGDLLLWNEDAALAEADVRRPPAIVTLSVRFHRDVSSGRVSRVSAVDGKPRPARAVLGVCPVVLFWPEDLALVRGGPDGRRRFLDVILAQTDQQAVAHMSRYRRVLEQRNALLHQLRLGGGVRDSLNSFTSELAHHGAWLAVARARLVDALAPLAAQALRDLSGQREGISLRYAPAHAASIPDSADAAEQALLETLRDRAAEEVARGITLAGPHRDDIAFDLDGRPARGTASQGQQRSIVLACKLAEVRYLQDTAGVAPVILLDDVLSELDPERRERLLALLATEGRHQVLVTTTEPLTEVGDFEDVRDFSVRDGVVTEDGSR
jgi:DNA replication and repair protein RecF